MVNQGGVEDARQLLDVVDRSEDALLVLGLEHHHQLAAGAFLMQLETG